MGLGVGVEGIEGVLGDEGVECRFFVLFVNIMVNIL